MKTERIYYFENSTEATATIVGLESSAAGPIAILDRTLFVPQGGGQPSDFGRIGDATVTHVVASKADPGRLLHAIDTLEGLNSGDLVRLSIDQGRRVLNSRFHTAGHLIAALVEEVLPGSRATGGHHWPGEARVEFDFKGEIPPSLLDSLAEVIEASIRRDLGIASYLGEDGERYVKIEGYHLVRCGGTHCAKLGELGKVLLRSIKQKKDTLRIGYHIGS